MFFFFFFFLFFYLFFFYVFLSLLLQCKFANSTLLSLLSFSDFITPYDAQASSAFSALIFIRRQAMVRNIYNQIPYTALKTKRERNKLLKLASVHERCAR